MALLDDGRPDGDESYFHFIDYRWTVLPARNAVYGNPSVLLQFR
jgi:hypothetical protein